MEIESIYNRYKLSITPLEYMQLCNRNNLRVIDKDFLDDRIRIKIECMKCGSLYNESPVYFRQYLLSGWSCTCNSNIGM